MAKSGQTGVIHPPPIRTQILDPNGTVLKRPTLVMPKIPQTFQPAALPRIRSREPRPQGVIHYDIP